MLDKQMTRYQRVSSRCELNGLQCFLAPGQQQFVTFPEVEGVTLAVGHGAFQNSFVFALQLRKKFLPGGCKESCVQIVHVLQNEENTFVGAGQSGGIPLRGGMDVTMAQFVIEVIQTHFYKIPNILLRVCGNKFTQFAIIIFCTMNQMADFQGIPSCHIIFAANKTAGFVIVIQGLNHRAVGVQIGNREGIQNYHNIDIAGFCCFAAEEAPLKAYLV